MDEPVSQAPGPLREAQLELFGPAHVRLRVHRFSKSGCYLRISPHFDDVAQANAFAIENRAEILEKYKAKKSKKTEKKDGEDFYRMLLEYYAKGSKYLKDDSVNWASPD